MSRPSALAQVLYNTEASWADTSTSTFGTALYVTNEVDVSRLTWGVFIPQRVTQLRNEITPEANAYLGGEFDIELPLTGLGSTAAGTITLNALMTLLGLVIGNATAGRAGALTCTGGTAAAPTTSAATGITAGALQRFGVIGDGRGNGQGVQVASHSASTATLLTALDAAPTNGDVIYNMCSIYGSEAPTSNDITSTRWRFLTANIQYDCRGCYPKKAVFSGLATGGEPKVRITFGVSVWSEVSVTFPDATTKQTFPTVPIAAGSFVLGTYGSTTRDATTKVPIRDFTLTWDLGIVELKGPGGTNANQMVIGCKRSRDNIMIDFVDDAESVTTSPKWRGKWAGNAAHHGTYTMAAADGASLMLRWPLLYPTGPIPTQFNLDNLNRVRMQWKASADSSKSTDLERAACILGIG